MKHDKPQDRSARQPTGDDLDGAPSGRTDRTAAHCGTFRVLLLRPDSGIETAPPPLGLISLAAWVRRKVLQAEVAVLDGRIHGWSTEEVLRRAQDFRPHVVGITALHADSAEAHALARGGKNRFPGVTVVLGGPYPSADPDAALADPCVDFVVMGEGELPFGELVDRLRRGEIPANIPGVLARGGVAREGPSRRQYVPDLDDLPRPAWDLLDWNANFSGRRRAMENPMQIHRRAAPLISSRGCPYGCVFCHDLFGKRFRAHSPRRVVEEVEYLVRELDVREIEFLDDTFNFDMDRAKEVFSLLIERGLSLPICFSNGLRADRVDDELLDLMKRAGVYRINYGIESAVPRILAIAGKHLDIGAARSAIEATAERRILAGAFFMLGFPTETEGEVRQTIEFATRSPLHTAVFALVTPFPGTDLYRIAEMERRTGNVRFSTVGHVSINMSAIPDARLESLRRFAYRRFYLRPSRVIRIWRDAPSRRRLFTNGLEVVRVGIFRKELYQKVGKAQGHRQD